MGIKYRARSSGVLLGVGSSGVEEKEGGCPLHSSAKCIPLAARCWLPMATND